MPGPRVSPARFPTEYGQTPESLADLMTWDEVSARIAGAINYLLATTTDSGLPYLRPVDGVFVDDALSFGGSPETRWVRHLQQRPYATASLPDDDHAVILEGRVEYVTDPELQFGKDMWAANVVKYPQYFTAGPPDFQPFWALRPQRVFAWSLTGFPKRATRFDFG